MKRRRRIIVGNIPERHAPATNCTETVVARTCSEVVSHLSQASYVELVIADLDLPDGTWFDLLRTVVAEALPGELVILGEDGEPLCRCALGTNDDGVRFLLSPT